MRKQFTVPAGPGRAARGWVVAFRRLCAYKGSGELGAVVVVPAEDLGLEEGAIDDQLPAALEQVDEADLPLAPLEFVAFSTAIHGIRGRSAARASRARVSAFSFTSICWRAAAQVCADTMGGLFIPAANVSLCRSCGFVSMCHLLPFDRRSRREPYSRPTARPGNPATSKYVVPRTD